MDLREMKGCLLSAVELIQLVDDGVIVGVDRESINAASIDLHLSEKFLIEVPLAVPQVIDLSLREKPNMQLVTGGVILHPGDFCLTATTETFHLPDYISGQFMLKSSLARSGLQHSLAGWADAGWNQSVLTLELSNILKHSSLKLKPGMEIGQMVFFKHTPVPPEFLYSTKGRYNGDKEVQQVKD